jgi:hypothetical protein
MDLKKTDSTPLLTEITDWPGWNSEPSRRWLPVRALDHWPIRPRKLSAAFFFDPEEPLAAGATVDIPQPDAAKAHRRSMPVSRWVVGFWCQPILRS